MASTFFSSTRLIHRGAIKRPKCLQSVSANDCTHQTTALKSIKSIAPLLDRILVQRVKAEAKTAGGIFLPESAVKELNEAKVLAVGPGAMDREGKRIQPSVGPGDKVLIPQVCTAFVSWLSSKMWRLKLRMSASLH